MHKMWKHKNSRNAPLQQVQSLRPPDGSPLYVDRKLRRVHDHEALLAFQLLSLTFVMATNRDYRLYHKSTGFKTFEKHLFNFAVPAFAHWYKRHLRHNQYFFGWVYVLFAYCHHNSGCVYPWNLHSLNTRQHYLARTS